MAEETGTPTLTAPTPVPTAEDPSLSVGGLLTDPEFPNLPLDEKIDVLRKRIKMDPDYRRLPEKMKTRMFAALLPGRAGRCRPSLPLQASPWRALPGNRHRQGRHPHHPHHPQSLRSLRRHLSSSPHTTPTTTFLTVNPQAGGGSATAIPQVVGESIARA